MSLRTGRRVGGFLSRLRHTDTDGVIGEEAGIALRIAEGIAEELLSGSASPATVLERAAARARGRATAVLLDEAHTLAAWPETERMALGAVLKDNQAMGVVVASSEQHALKQLTAADGPLRYVGARFALAEIAREDWQVGLQERFAKLGAPVTAGALNLLLDQSRGHPYCTMLLAHESGRLGIDLGGVSEVVVEAALVTVRRDETWQQLRSSTLGPQDVYEPELLHALERRLGERPVLLVGAIGSGSRQIARIVAQRAEMHVILSPGAAGGDYEAFVSNALRQIVLQIITKTAERLGVEQLDISRLMEDTTHAAQVRLHLANRFGPDTETVISDQPRCSGYGLAS